MTNEQLCAQKYVKHKISSGYFSQVWLDIFFIIIIISFKMLTHGSPNIRNIHLSLFSPGYTTDYNSEK